MSTRRIDLSNCIVHELEGTEGYLLWDVKHNESIVLTVEDGKRLVEFIRNEDRANN